MTTNKATLEEKLTAISTHYRNPDGTPCSTLPEVEALPEFQSRFPAAMKVERDDSLAATIHVIDSLLEVEESLDGLPCWVLNPEDYDVRPKAGVTMDGDDIATGVRIVLPGGAQRFLRNIDPAIASSLKPGQSVTLAGAVKRTNNLLTRNESYRIGKESTLTTTPHDESVPHLGLDYFVGATVKENGWGPYSLDGDRNVLRGSFGPQFFKGKKHDNYNGPLYVTLEFGGCAWTDDEKGLATMFVKSPDGYEGIGEVTQAWAAENFGVPVASERDDYSEKMRGKWILSRCNGSIFRSLKTKELGGQEKVEAEIDDLRSNGLLKPYGDKGTELLAIPRAHAEACKEAGDWPHIEFSDQKVHDVKVSGSGFTTISTVPLDGKLEFNLMHMELTSREGNPYQKNEGLWCVPLHGVEAASKRIDPEDPSLAELRRLKATV